MAKKKRKRSKSKSVHPKQSGARALKTKMTKRQLVEHLAVVVGGEDTPSRETKRQVAATLDALGETMARSLVPGGAGEFMLPKLLKITLRTRKAIKAGTMVRSPATGGMVASKGRPESKTVKVRPLAMLKKAAAGEL